MTTDYPTIQRRAYRVPEAMAMLGGWSRSKFYAEARAGRIRLLKCGRMTLIAAEEIDRVMAGLSPSSTAA